MVRRTQIVIGAVVAALLTCGFAGGVPASAAGVPEWNVMSTTNPTNLVPNSPRDEVQEIVVDATGGTFKISANLGEAHNGFQTTKPLAYNATAAQVLAALNEKGSFEISHSVTVVGAGSDETAPFTITYTSGEWTDNSVPPLFSVNGSELTGPGAHASARVVTRGEFPPEIRVLATNIGGAPTNGSQITVTDVLPTGIDATSVEGGELYGFGGFEISFFPNGLQCSGTTTIVCTSSAIAIPGDQLAIKMRVRVAANAAEHLDSALSVSGGGAATTSAEGPLTVSNTPASFGVEPGSVLAAISSHEAGGHPNVTTAFTMNQSDYTNIAGFVKDIRFDTPPGLVGDVVNMPRCTMAAVMEQPGSVVHPCPSDTMVGMATVRGTTSTAGPLQPGNEPQTYVTPVYNIAPAPGEPAAFAFDAFLFPYRLDTSVLSNGDDAVRVTAPNMTENVNVIGASVTIWGVPSEYNGPGNDYGSFFSADGTFGGSGVEQGEPAVPLLTNPQQCSAPLGMEMETDSWQASGSFVVSPRLPLGSLTGCEQLLFEPSYTMVPDTLEAGAPAGYSFNLKVPQRNEIGVPATPTVKKVTLTLPPGTVVNPSAAWGLQACSNAQFYGPDHPSEEVAEPAKCPRQAQVGKITIKSPDIEEALEGEVYLAEPECDPCTPMDAEDGKMVRLFVNVVGTGEAGIVVKLEGHGMINQQNGQITTVFDEDPQLPFSELSLKLNGGPRSVLANPRTCGQVSSTLDMASWDEALPVALRTSPFEVDENCFGPQFNPSFAAGMPNIQAGANGEFTLAFGRSDHDEMLKQITLHMPPGLLGTLTGVELCKEAQANAGTCGAGSLIGTVAALTGPGANSFLVEGGKVYLTEGYGGAPYGLSIVVPAVAGPYTLSGTTGNGTVVVRSQIFVDPTTAQLTVVSGQLPSVLDGIPLQLRAVNVRINRSGFTFNPTSCEKMAVSGTIAAQEGLSANVTAPFQVTNCETLGFKPSFKVSTSGQTSRANGASLHVSLSYPNAAAGSEANIKSVKVDLPKQLPSRLETLQKACPVATFEANPAACSAASRIGTAKATTPIIPVPLEGPVYFVSHAGEKFPELVIVLSGYGVTVQLHSETFISKAGITSSTFRTIPDVPVGTFELTLPEGPFSALAAPGGLCSVTKTVIRNKKVTVKSKNGRKKNLTRKVKVQVAGSLVMPTAFTAQNGMAIHQNTPIEVTGCVASKAKKKTKHKKKK